MNKIIISLIIMMVANDLYAMQKKQARGVVSRYEMHSSPDKNRVAYINHEMRQIVILGKENMKPSFCGFIQDKPSSFALAHEKNEIAYIRELTPIGCPLSNVNKHYVLVVKDLSNGKEETRSIDHPEQAPFKVSYLDKNKLTVSGEQKASFLYGHTISKQLFDFSDDQSNPKGSRAALDINSK